MAELGKLQGVRLQDLGINPNPNLSIITGFQFNLEPSIYGGTLVSHPGDGSPFRIKRYPEGVDKLPVNQAIATLGGEYYYWDRLGRLLLHPDKFTQDYPLSMDVLPVYLDNRGQIYVDIKTDKNPPVVRSVNYGGDLDFAKPRRYQSVFPLGMYIGENYVEVTTEELGVPPEVGIAIHDLYWGVRDTYSGLYCQALVAVKQVGGLGKKIEGLIDQEEVDGLKVRSASRFFSLLMKGKVDEKTYYEVTTKVQEQVKALIMQKQEEDPFAQTVQMLATQMGIAYHAAIAFCPEFVY